MSSQQIVYKTFFIVPEPLEFFEAPDKSGKNWTIGGFIWPQNHADQQESFFQKGVYASTFDEAINQTVVYAKSLIDSRV